MGPPACRASCEETAPPHCALITGDTTPPWHAWSPARRPSPSGCSALPRQLQASPCSLQNARVSGQGAPAPPTRPGPVEPGEHTPAGPPAPIHLSLTPQSQRTSPTPPAGSLRTLALGTLPRQSAWAGASAGRGRALPSLRTQREVPAQWPRQAGQTADPEGQGCATAATGQADARLP